MDNSVDHKRAAVSVPASVHSQDRSQASYRDDPDALSMHTTRSDYEYDDMPELPAYSDVVPAESAPSHINNVIAREDQYRAIPQPHILNKRLNNKDCSPKVSVGSETSIRMDEHLMDPDHLCEYITDYLRVMPPQPSVRIHGTHLEKRQKTGSKQKEQERVTDFDIVLSLQPFLPKAGDESWWSAYTHDGGIKTYRGSFRKTRAEGYKQDIEVGHAQGQDLQGWCKAFCEDKSMLKIFRIERDVLGMNVDYIHKQLELLIRSTHYRGHIAITFPIADKNVDIYSPNWLNRARISWVRWVFYLTFLWIFTWPVLFFMTKKWNVYKVDWLFSQTKLNQATGEVEVSYATISEKDWVERHGNLIRSLVLDKYQGDGTQFPTDIQLDPNARRADVRIPQIQLGNGAIGTAISALQGGMSVWRNMNGQGDQGWGYDER